MLKSKKWLFFDVGNVILNDDPGVAFVYKKIHDAILDKGIDMTFDDLLIERGKLFSDPNKKLIQDLVSKYFTQEEALKLKENYVKEGYPKWYELSPLIPKAKDFVSYCAAKYNLGIIANQPKECAEVLERHDLLKYFKTVALSDVVGKHKPDKDFFLWALKNAGAKPSESIMLGDRVDNDVRPAKELGFTTIHLKLDVYAKVENHSISEELKTYLPHVHKHNISMRKPSSESEVPHYEAESYEELEQHFS